MSNKTPATVASWILQPRSSFLLAVEANRIVAAGKVSDDGHIALNYVLPDARFQGVSRMLLKAMESRAADRGSVICTLTSTETARRFYLRAGYVETGPPCGAFGTDAGFPMAKRLVLPGVSA